MGLISEIHRELADRMMFQTELASKMKGNTKTRVKDLSNILSNKREPGAKLLEEIAEGLGCEWKLVEKEIVLKDYVIFDKGNNGYPGVYQVLSYLDGNPDFSSATLLHHDLEYIRGRLKELGMKKKSSERYQHPMVIEVWEGEELPRLMVL